MKKSKFQEEFEAHQRFLEKLYDKFAELKQENFSNKKKPSLLEIDNEC